MDRPHLDIGLRRGLRLLHTEPCSRRRNLLDQLWIFSVPQTHTFLYRGANDRLCEGRTGDWANCACFGGSTRLTQLEDWRNAYRCRVTPSGRGRARWSLGARRLGAPVRCRSVECRGIDWSTPSKATSRPSLIKGTPKPLASIPRRNPSARPRYSAHQCSRRCRQPCVRPPIAKASQRQRRALGRIREPKWVTPEVRLS
jgi:hypothetical protein